MEFKKPKKFKTPTEEEDWSCFLNRLWEMSQQMFRTVPNIDPYIPPATPERGLLEVPFTIPNENFRIQVNLPPELENIFEQPIIQLPIIEHINHNITINQDGTISIQDD